MTIAAPMTARAEASSLQAESSRLERSAHTDCLDCSGDVDQGRGVGGPPDGEHSRVRARARLLSGRLTLSWRRMAVAGRPGRIGSRVG